MVTSGGGRADARRNRDAILRAGAELLAGGQDVSMAGVARAAGVTRVTVYRHFADRDELLDALVTTYAGELLPGMLDSIADASPQQAMERLARLVVEAVAPHRALLRSLAPRLEQVTRQAVADEPITGLLTRWRERGELTVALTDDWLARSIRALCLVAALDESPPDEVTRQLALSLGRLVS